MTPEDIQAYNKEQKGKTLKTICHDEHGKKVATIHYSYDKEGKLDRFWVRDVKKRKRSKIETKSKKGRKI